jgi:phospholipid-binding lipoprotein MlaA
MSLFRPVMLAPALVVCLGACAAPPSPEVVPDPYEASNRRVHEFNKGADSGTLSKASAGYVAMPSPIREGIGNFGDFVATPTYFVNHMLQGKLDAAGENLFRFGINGTLGIAGIFDPESSFSLERREGDFGQTMYVWGVPSGAYQELPLVGPSTQRDTAGWVVDIVTNPFVLVGFTTDALTDRGSFSESYDQILHESADSYAQTRDIYLQYRAFELEGGEGEDYFDPYDDILE